MDLTTLRLRVKELLGDAAEGSSTYAPGGSNVDVDAAINKAQDEAASVLGLTYAEAIVSVTAAIGATGSSFRVPPSATLPTDMISLVRVQVYDASMTDIVT